MRTFFAVAAGVGVGFVLGLAFHGTALKVGAVSPPKATLNGDTNGDGTRDLSDAVYLLQFLFSGGGEIAEIDCQASPDRIGVVATGQTTCVGDGGTVACSIPKARGQDAFYHLGCPPEGRFVDNSDGTVFDSCTGLMWTKYHVDTDGDGELLPADSRTWLEACQFAEDMSYLGHDDWRVPNIQELLSLVNFGNTFQPAAPLFAPFDQELLGTGITYLGGTWSSTFVQPGARAFAIGAQGREGVTCECCVTRQINKTELHPFIAVRGPVTRP